MNSRAASGQPYVPTPVEHKANILTHLALVIPSCVATQRMYYNSACFTEKLVSIIYGLANILLFTMSSLFHVASFVGFSKRLTRLFHYGDRAVIYLFIASSYTPWLVLRHFEQRLGHVFLWLTWIAAIVGITYQYVFFERHKNFETFLYIVIASFPACAWFFMIDLAGTFEMIVGGIFYGIGVVFFKSDGKIPFAHAIWHIFVLLGATVHFLAVDEHLFNPD